MEVQTRSSTFGTRIHPSVREAHDAFQADPTIWKISWYMVENGKVVHYYFTSKRPTNKEEPAYEAKLQRLSLDYKTACTTAPNAVFWINEPPNFDGFFQTIRSGISEDQAREIFKIGCVKEVLRNQNFRQKYCL